ncbi:MAG: hypothetical protein K8R23_20550 [Chthoniobacter sp.]|nr:hypothetical protein [Chthoniobacter sp.]
MLLLTYKAGTPAKVSDLLAAATKHGLGEATKWNVSDILLRAKPLAARLPDGWILTVGGREHVSSKLLGNASTPLSSASQNLHDELKKIAHVETRHFVEEAVGCLNAGLLRAAVVFSWVGAIAVLHTYVLHNQLVAFNVEARRRNVKWKDAKTADDFASIKESEFLDILVAISVLGKNVKEQLKNHCLGLRNSCGHPSSLKLGENTVAAHIELLVLNVFARFAA